MVIHVFSCCSYSILYTSILTYSTNLSLLRRLVEDLLHFTLVLSKQLCLELVLSVLYYMCKSSLGGLVRTLMLDLTLIFWLPFLGERFSVLDKCVSITFVEPGYNANIGNNCKFLLLVRLFKSRDSIQFATRNTKIHSCTETAFMVCVLRCKQMLTL